MPQEFQLKVKLTPRELTEIKILFDAQPSFQYYHDCEGMEYIEYFYPENESISADISVGVETDIIYILKEKRASLWQDLEFLKIYLEENNIKFEVV